VKHYAIPEMAFGLGPSRTVDTAGTHSKAIIVIITIIIIIYVTIIIFVCLFVPLLLIILTLALELLRC
jgi:hypothetical protein